MSNDFLDDNIENEVLHVEKEETIQTQDGDLGSDSRGHDTVDNDSVLDSVDDDPETVKEVHHEEVHRTNDVDGTDDVTVNGVDFDRTEDVDTVRDGDVSRHDEDDRGLGEKIKDKVEEFKR